MRFSIGCCALLLMAAPALAWAGNCPPRQNCQSSAPARQVQSRPAPQARPMQRSAPAPNMPMRQPSAGGGRPSYPQNGFRPGGGQPAQRSYQPRGFAPPQSPQRGFGGRQSYQGQGQEQRRYGGGQGAGPSGASNSQRRFGDGGGPASPRSNDRTAQFGERRFGGPGRPADAWRARPGVPPGGAHRAADRARQSRAAFARPPRSRGGGRFVYRGRSYGRFAVRAYAWPRGYGYRRYVVGGYLPAVYWTPDYFIEDYGYYDLAPPPPAYQWIRYGPDLALISLDDGSIAQMVYGVFDESGGPPSDDGASQGGGYGPDGGSPPDGDPDQMPGDPPPPEGG